MERLITQELIKWKSQKNYKPLIIRGARQVGKSFSIMDFGRNHFEGKVHLLDFEQRPDWNRLFEKNLDAGRIMSELEVLMGSSITAGKDLLFFDEIQSCPRAIMSLRYFYEQIPELHVIAAGSLLEFALKDISFPVGRIQILDMFPLTFSEFLLATGNSNALEIVLAKPREQPELIHNMLNDELRKYFFIGGMPECVKTYINSGSMHAVFEVQSNLVNSYRLDFPKYAQYSNKHCINAVVVSTAKSVGQQIKYSRLAEDFSNPTIKKAFDLLCQARIINKVPSASPEGLPLEASASQRFFKALVVDIGIMQCLSGMAVNTEYAQSDLLAIYRGALAEQFVGQEFAAAMDRKVYYWTRKAKSSTAEVDYLIAVNNRILPVEVKSGSAGSLRSMHLLLQTYSDCPNGYVLSGANYKELPDQKLVFIPLYYAYSFASGKY
jgi:uncharacterized protein